MGFNTFGPLLVLDTQLTPAAGVVGSVVDATTGATVQAYNMDGTAISLVTNARGYVGQFQAPDTSVMLRVTFGDLALDVVAKEAIASGGGVAGVSSVDGITGAVSLSSTYEPLKGADDNYVSDAEKAALHTHPAVIAQGDTQADARTAIGAGTSSLVVGTGAGDAKAGNYAPAWTDVTSKPTTFAPVIGTGATDAAAGNHDHATAYAPISGQFAVNTVASSGATETLPTTHAAHKVTLSENCTFTFTSPTAGHAFVLYLSGEFTPTWPASVDWAGGVAPTYASAGTLYHFATLDGGTTWLGSGQAYL